ncbi:MAG: hypothetical protein OHK0038_27960 [Flammeovirgaceae bacterium]
MKILQIVIIFFLSCHILNAQKIEWGAKIGARWHEIQSNFIETDSFYVYINDSENRILDARVPVGIYVKYKFNRLSIQSEIMGRETSHFFYPALYDSVFPPLTKPTILFSHTLYIPLHLQLEVFRNFRLTGGFSVELYKTKSKPYFYAKDARFLNDIINYSLPETVPKSMFYYEYGIQYSLKRFTLEWKYLRNIGSFTKNLPYDNHSFSFKTSHHALMVSLAYRFNKLDKSKKKTKK